MKTIGERIIFLREEQGMKQTELADRIGITKMTLYKYEKDKCEPRSEIISRLCDVLGTTADFLIGRTNDPSPLQRDDEKEQDYLKQNTFLQAFNRLSKEDQIRISERMEVLLEKN